MSKFENLDNENIKNVMGVKIDESESSKNEKDPLSSIFKSPFSSPFKTNLFKPLFGDDK